MEKKTYTAPRLEASDLQCPPIMEITNLSKGEGHGTGVAESNKREDRNNTKDAKWGNLW